MKKYIYAKRNYHGVTTPVVIDTVKSGATVDLDPTTKKIIIYYDVIHFITADEIIKETDDLSEIIESGDLVLVKRLLANHKELVNSLGVVYDIVQGHIETSVGIVKSDVVKTVWKSDSRGNFIKVLTF